MATCMRGGCPAWGHPVCAEAADRLTQGHISPASAGALLASAALGTLEALIEVLVWIAAL